MVQVTEKKTFDGGKIVENGLRDERLGPLKGRCKTCGENRHKCNGHFGHIVLYRPVYHISWVNNLIYWLRCVCYTCDSFILKDLTPPRLQKNKHLQYYSKNTHNKCPKCETSNQNIGGTKSMGTST